ncbi:MAG: MASE1 domain-containing protein [Oligoflexales bacterium]
MFKGLIERGREYRSFLFVVPYVACLAIGHSASFDGERFSIFWPSNGILVGLFLIEPFRRWWPIALTGFILNCVFDLWSHELTPFHSLAFSFCNLLSATISAFGLRKLALIGNKHLEARFPFVAFFVSCIILGPSIGAVFASASIAGIQNFSHFLFHWQIWSVADAMGNLAIVPIVLMYGDQFGGRMTKAAFPSRSIWEWVGTLAAVGACAWFIFSNSAADRSLFEYPYLLFPLMGWVSLRLGMKGSAIALAIVMQVGVWASVRLLATIFRFHENESTGLLALQLYLISLYFMSFLLASLYEQRFLDAYNLKRLSNKLTSALEEERKRIAYDLHDNIGQLLAALKMSVGAIGHIEHKEQRLELGKVAAQVLDQAFESLRATSKDLRPTIIDDIGLKSAFLVLAEDVQKASGIEVRLNLGSDIPVGGKAAVDIYRITQEALCNAIKHSGTEAIDISLDNTNKKRDFVLTIKDYGQGMSNNRIGGEGLGLITMRERASRNGGVLTIGSNAARGTTVQVRFPEASLS